MFKTLMCGDREVKLRYQSKALLSIRDTAGKIIGADRLTMIKSPFKADGKVPVEVVLNFINELDVLIWLFGKGLDWKESGAKPEEANALYDTYMDVPEEELDTGERYEAFQMAIGEAIAASRGVDLKKTIEKQKAEQAEREAKIIADAESRAKNGIGTKPTDSASESSGSLQESS